MKLTEAGRAQQKEMRDSLVHSAMQELWAVQPTKMANAVQSRVRSTLATHVTRKRRGSYITYTLVVPEINQTFVRSVFTTSEYEG